MFSKRSALSALLLMLMLLTACATAASVQALEVPNTPVKAQILFEKKGLSSDGHELPLPGAIFEVRAAETITGRDGTKWFDSGALVATITTDTEGTAATPLLPLGRYEVTETLAPEGYVRDETVHTVELLSRDHITPIVSYTILATNCENEVLLQKQDQNGSVLSGAEFGLFNETGRLIMLTSSGDEGMIRFAKVPDGSFTIRETKAPDGYLICKEEINLLMSRNWKNTGTPIATLTNQQKRISFLKVDTSGKPLEGVAFSLINAKTNTVVERVVSDANGMFHFTKFDYGTWIVHETEAPDGYNRMEDIVFTVDDDWTEPAPVMCVNIPDHYEFVKTDSSGKALKGAKFRLEDEDGNKLGEYESDKNGIVRIDGLEPGEYVIRETKAPDGYVVSGKKISLAIDEYYVAPDEDDLPAFINYTEIQTGVSFVVTGVMWFGASIMIIAVIWEITRRRKRD